MRRKPGLLRRGLRWVGALAIGGALTTSDVLAAGVPPLIKAEVRPWKGTPMLFINGKLTTPLWFFDNLNDVADHTKIASELALAAKHGIGIHEIMSRLPWKDSAGKRDYTYFDTCIREALASNPGMYLSLRLYIYDPSDEWLRTNADAKLLDENGQRVTVPWRTNWFLASIYSPVWKQDVKDNIKALVEHINASAFSDNIIGFNCCYLSAGEWFYELPTYTELYEFSTYAVTAFQGFVRRRYPTEAALRVAWRKPDITFDQVRIPTRAERSAGDVGAFATRAPGCMLYDYYEFLNTSVAETQIEFCRTFKECDPRRLLKIFYGYLFELPCNFRNNGAQNSGHYALRTVLDSPWVDIVASPYSYIERGNNNGSFFMSPVDSVILNNKMWFNEDDTRTHLTPADSGFDRCTDLNMTLQIVRRNFAAVLTHGAGTWWMDLPGAGWWDQAEIFAELQKLTSYYTRYLAEAKECRFAAEVAVILDEKSFYSQAFVGRLMMQAVSYARPELALMGAPCGYYLLSDLAAGRVPPAKLYLFLNAFDVSSQERAWIDANLKQQNKVLAWVYAPGLMKDGVASAENMRLLTGIDLGYETAAATLMVQLSRAVENPIVRKAGVEVFGDPDLAVGPRCFSRDRKAQVLGTYKNIGGDALVVRDMGEWRSVFIGSPRLESGMLRGLCAYAGVDLYVETADMVYANHSFFGIFTRSAGTKTIRLPEARTVIDMQAQRTIATGVRTFSIDCALNETKLFLLK